MHEAAKCHPERDALTHSSGLCAPCYRRAYYLRHRDKWREYDKRWRSEHRDQANRKSREYYARERIKQRAKLPETNKCAICLRIRPLVMDHDHKDQGAGWRADLVHRGLLCNSCNIALGSFMDDPAVLRRAIRYLGGRA